MACQWHRQCSRGAHIVRGPQAGHRRSYPQIHSGLWVCPVAAVEGVRRWPAELLGGEISACLVHELPAIDRDVTTGEEGRLLRG